MRKRPSFQTLDVYRLSEELSDSVWKIVANWRPFERDTVGKQLVRAADSIGANIAEGNGRWNFQDNRRFIRIARGSLYEVQHWLRRAYRRQFLSEADVNSLRAILDELNPRLNAYLKSIGRNKAPPQNQSPNPDS